MIYNASERQESYVAQHIVGIDIGGTKIYACLVDESGVVVARAKQPSPTDTPAALMAAVIDVVRVLVAKAGLDVDSIAAIGAGVPGVVDANGTCLWAPNCPLTGVAVARELHEVFGVPVAVGNDVNVGTLGEKAFGVGRGYDNVFGMFVGTGIGGGLVVNGEIVIGDHCLGAEVGHIVVDVEAARRGDPGGGEFEYIAGRLGIERSIKAALAAGRDSVIKGKLRSDGSDRLKSGLLKAGVDAGDEVVCEVLTHAAQIIGLACVTVIYLVDPEALIMGGGVIEACGDFMLPIIESTIAAHVKAVDGRAMVVLRSELGDDAVALGAAALGRARLGTAAPTGGESAAEVQYPIVLAEEFGRVLVGGDERQADVVVRADGTVKKRRQELSSEVHGTAHEVSADEVRYVCKGKPTLLVVGVGFEGLVTLSREAEAWLTRKGIRSLVLPSPQAAEAFNQAGERKALLLHVGC